MHTRVEPPDLNYLRSINSDCKAVLWDMDGTIMKTEMLHAEAILSIIIDRNPSFELTTQIIQTDCWGETDFMVHAKYQRRKLLEDLSFDQYCHEKEEIIRNGLKTLDPKKLIDQKIKDHLQELKNAGIMQAVVTSSERAITHLFLDFLEIKDFFQIIITREDTTENKPHPRPYLFAMEQLNLSAGQIVIYEDSAVGLQSATAAGATVCHAKWYENH